MRKSGILIGFTVVFAISVLGGTVGYYLLVSSQQKAQPWMFIGAYATYDGQIDSFSGPYSLNATIQVTDQNASYVQLRTNSTIATSFSPALTDQSTQWTNKTNISFQHRGETLVSTYSTQIAVKDVGTRPCTIYDYINKGGINATYYLDNALQWPLRIIYVTDFENQTYTLEFNLRDTNIDSLRAK